MLKAAGVKRFTEGLPVWLMACFSAAIGETKVQCAVAIDERKWLQNRMYFKQKYLPRMKIESKHFPAHGALKKWPLVNLSQKERF